MSADAEARLQGLLDRLAELRQALSETGDDPARALQLLGEISEVTQQATDELERAQRAARDARDEEGV